MRSSIGLLVALWAITFSVQGQAEQPRGRLLEILRHSQSCGPSLEGLGAAESVGFERAVGPNPLHLETERFQLRPLTPDDIDAAAAIYTHPDVMKVSGDYLDHGTVASIIHQGSQSIDQFRRGTIVNFGIFEKGTNKLIGMSQLGATPPAQAAYQSGIAKPGEIWLEVSFHLHPSYQGKKIAPEVAMATTRMAFAKFDVAGIHGQHIEGNIGSGKVLEKLGMKRIQSDPGGYVHYALRRPMDGTSTAVTTPPPAAARPGRFPPPVVDGPSGFEPFIPPGAGAGGVPFLRPDGP